MVFDWEELYAEVGKPKPEPPKPEVEKKTKSGFLHILVAFTRAFFRREDRIDAETWRWGYEPRAGWNPDRGGGV